MEILAISDGESMTRVHEIFVRHGWKKVAATGEYCYQTIVDDRFCQATFELSHNKHSYIVELSVAITSQKFETTMRRLFAFPQPFINSLGSKFLEAKCADDAECGTTLEALIVEAESWIKSQEIGEFVRSIDRCYPGETLKLQLMHLTALALDGAYFKLMDYKNALHGKLGTRFVPAIKPWTLERAIEISLEQHEKPLIDGQA